MVLQLAREIPPERWGFKTGKSVGEEPGSGAEPGGKVNIFLTKMRHLY